MSKNHITMTDIDAQANAHFSKSQNCPEVTVDSIARFVESELAMCETIVSIGLDDGKVATQVHTLQRIRKFIHGESV